MTVELLFAAIFFLVLVYGIMVGRMPLRWFDPDRARNPLAFWLVGAGYAGLALLFLFSALGPAGH